MQSISPVFTEKEVGSEQVIALDQPEFLPIIVARIRFEDDTPASVVRFKFTDKERELVARGADLIVSQPHLGAYMPLGLQFAFTGEYPFGQEELL